MFLGYVQLGGTFIRALLVKNGGLPVEPDSAPSFKVFNDADVAFSEGFLSGPFAAIEGAYKVTLTASSLNGFARGTYSMLVQYEVSGVDHADAYVFTVT